MIKIQNLSKTYKSKTKALKNINLNINKNIHILLGHNGAGKTTLINIITTVIDFKEGVVLIDGEEVKKQNYNLLRRKIGYMPQEFSCYPNMTIYDLMEYFAILHEVDKNIIKDRINHLLESVTLENEKKKKFKELSGGMKRRLALAVSLINDPDILIVDEPTTGVDPEERIKIRMLLAKFCIDKQLILSTHILEDAEFLDGDITILVKGNVVVNNTKELIINEFSNKIWQYEFQEDKKLVEIANNHIIVKEDIINNKKYVYLYSDTCPLDGAFLKDNITLEDAYMTHCRLYNNKPKSR